MKTVRRAAFALLTLVAPLSMADPPPPDSHAPAVAVAEDATPARQEREIHRLEAIESELQQRLRALESEVARLRVEAEGPPMVGEPVTAP